MAAPTSTSILAGDGEQPTHTTSDAVRRSSTSRSINSETNLEMSDLDASGVSKNTTTGAGPQSGLLNDISIPHSSPLGSSFPTMTSTSTKPEATPLATDTRVENIAPSNAGGAASAGTPAASTDPSSSNNADITTSAATSNAPPMSRLDSIAIGPSVETMPAVATTSEAGPVLVITLLLTSGARHPYKIDEKYLTKRNVNVPGVTEGGKKDPFSISVYTLKELILREWREEWEAQPSSPSSIRLIYFGRLLDDKTALKECRFNADSANVVHMTVRPQDIVDEEDASKGKGMSRDRGDGESNAGCRCVVQ